MSETNGPLPTYPINDILPVEILGSIFEEHAKCLWRAPAIHGQVCRFWRQVVLNTPRAWAYLEVYSHNRPSISELRLWLHRSGAALLHIHHDIPLYGHSNTYSLDDFLGDCHTRITSLQMVNDELFFLERKAFPYLRFLDVRHWNDPFSTLPPIQWGPMPQLRSLRLGPTNFCVAPLDSVAPLKMLTLRGVNCTSLPRHSPSLTKLMLQDVCLEGIISGPLTFPSLTFLSLFTVTGLKQHINAPYLVTYHEGGSSIRESLSAPQQSLVEYGIYLQDPDILYPDGIDPTVWNHHFPNISRLSMQVPSHLLKRVVDSLCGHTHPLPPLQMITVKGLGGRIEGEESKFLESRLRGRNEAHHTGVVLRRSEDRQPYHLPPFFAGDTRILLEDL